MRRKLIPISAALYAALFLSAVRASEVDYYIVTVGNPQLATGTWQVYANVSHDNDGLASFDINVMAEAVPFGTSTIGGISTKTPNPVDTTGQYQGGGDIMGFNSTGKLAYDANNDRDFNAHGFELIAFQGAAYYDPMNGGSDDPASDMGALVGVGQEPSSASPQNGTQGPIDGSGSPTGISTPVWNWVPVGQNQWGQTYGGTLIEQGTYDATREALGTLLTVESGGVGTGVTQVLGTDDGGFNELWGLPPYQNGNTQTVKIVGDTISVALDPEPASVGLIIIGMGLLGTGRRFRPESAKSEGPA